MFPSVCRESWLDVQVTMSAELIKEGPKRGQSISGAGDPSASTRKTQRGRLTHWQQRKDKTNDACNQTSKKTTNNKPIISARPEALTMSGQTHHTGGHYREGRGHLWNRRSRCRRRKSGDSYRHSSP